MKWILAICLLISITSLGQTDDSTKYIHYKAQYGQRMPRGWWDSVAHMPYGDTALFAKPARPGAIMMHTNKLFYRWDGTGWRELGSGSGVASLKSAGNGFSLVLPPDSIRSLEPFGSWIAIDTSVDRKKARIYITPQAGDGLKVNPFTDAIERDTTRSTGIPTYHYIDSLANLEDSLVIVNQGDGENISYIQNDSIVIKKITGTGAATVTTANDSTIVIDVEATTPLLTSTQVAYGSGTNEMTSEPSFNYTAASNALHADSMLTIRTRADSLFANHRIGIGTTQPQFFLHSQGSNPTIGIVDTRALSSTNGASILLYNQGTPSAAGQRLGQFLFGTNPSGTTFRNSAAVAAYSNGAWTDGSSHPTDIAFEITQAGGSSRVEVARFKSTGQLGIGTSAPHMRLTLAGSSSSSTQTGVEAYQYGGALGGVFVGLSSRGTESVPTATQANDTIARFGGAGYGTSQTAPYTTGTVQVLAEENFTNTSMPTGMLFQTTPTGSNVRLNRMYIAANGGVRIGSTSWAADIAARTFYINGSVGANKDSLPVVASITNEKVLIQDTTTGQFKRILASAIGGGGSVSDEAYDATTWNGVTGVSPSKNAIRDKLEEIISAEFDLYNSEGRGFDILRYVSGNEAYLRKLLVRGVGVTVDTTASTDSTMIVDLTVSGAVTGTGISGRVAYWDGSSSLTSNSNFLFGASTGLSVGTTNTQGRLNLGGNKDLSSSGVQSYFAPATYTDQITSASGTASDFVINYIASPTIAAANNSVTFPFITNLLVDQPTAGTNATITEGYAIATGTGGNLLVQGNVDVLPLSSGGTQPSTSGAMASVMADANGRLSFLKPQTVTSSATVTPTSGNNIVTITAQATGLTIANPTGTFLDGQAFLIALKDNNSSQTVAFGTDYNATDFSLTVATVSGKWRYYQVVYNATAAKFFVTGKSDQP